VNVRAATEADLPRLKELWSAFAQEVPEPDYVQVDHEEELREIEEIVREQVAVLAERDGEVVGFALARTKGSKLGFVSDLYVVPDARRERVAQALTREVVTILRGRGAEAVQLEVLVENGDARSVYERWGFRETLLTLTADAAELEQRLGREDPEPSVGRVYAQTDDVSTIERSTAQFIPRLGRSARTVVHPPRGGWICVDDELCSGDPKLLRRLAQELSYRTAGVVLSLGIEEGAVVRYVLFERGSVADEYASLPEYCGPLPPGDVIALSANPTVVARLTGADAGRLRAVALTASSPADLPPPEELLAELAEVLGIGSGP
jgi:ribosomal protein S18 acetylase RimI-like enzyme